MLTARYDGATLRPPDPLPPGRTRHPAQEHAAWQGLRQWCLDGSGGRPKPALPMSVACLVGGDGPTRAALAQALCLERDGSLQLAARQGSAGRLALRLQTKLHDLMTWRERAPDDAWDAGYLHTTEAGLQALRRFVPRRATLMVAEGLSTAQLQAVVQGLVTTAANTVQPLRLLMLNVRSGPACTPSICSTFDLDSGR